jgi:hypothetical protein
MKHILTLLFSTCLLGSVFAVDYTGLDAARELSEENIIVDYSMIAGDSEIQESSLYKLDTALVRQEALGIALKLKNINLPEEYACLNYFSDTKESWVCRAAELAADNYIISRVNTLFRPKDTLTAAEAIGIAIKALDISLSTTNTSTMKSDIPAWQKRLLLTLSENNITLYA